MKKFAYLIALVLFSCSSDVIQDNAKEGEASLMKELTQLHNEDKEYMKAEYNRNEVEVATDNNAIILVNYDNGTAESFIMLKFEDEVPSELRNLANSTYEIVDLKGEMAIKSEGKILYFSTFQKPKFNDSFKSDKVYNVIEISKHLLDEDIPRESDGQMNMAKVKEKATCKCVSIWSYETCDAGGEGSNFCSGSTCSVSCGERYFSCCQEG